jgi:glycosyltransferase involved in cell wall biosynthesis
MAEAPLVSVVIIFLDAERFIEEAIGSVLHQTFDGWELILVDDGSRDGSTAIARRFAAEHPDRIRYLDHEGHANRGKSASRNLGIAEAKGRYVAFLDSDDVWLPQRLERQVAVLERHPEVAMVYGPTLHWHGWTGDPADAGLDHVRTLSVEPERSYEPPFLLTRFLELANGSQPGICSILVRRRAALEIGGFDAQFRDLFEDQVFLSKICLLLPVYVVADCLDRYRQHPDSCCSVAARRDGYDPDRPNPMKRAYLEWLEAYIAGRGIDDARLAKALRFELLAYRSPLRYWIATAPRRLPYALKLKLRRLGLLPPARRHPLPI